MYRCPYCEAPVSSTGQAPVDDEQNDFDTWTSFACGHETFAGFVRSPCPSDPEFPQLDDFELHFLESQNATVAQWLCTARGKTEMAKCVRLMQTVGRTKEEAELRLRDAYARRSKKWKT